MYIYIYKIVYHGTRPFPQILLPLAELQDTHSGAAYYGLITLQYSSGSECGRWCSADQSVRVFNSYSSALFDDECDSHPISSPDRYATVLLYEYATEGRDIRLS